MYQVHISGKLVDPLVEGGKGLGASDGRSCGAWAKCGGAGTFSGMCARAYDDNGNDLLLRFTTDTREGRHRELIAQEIDGAIDQAKIAYDIAGGNGAIQMNVLWEASGVPQILEGMLAKAAHFIDGIVCGAGLPFALAEIAAKYKVYYNPIVSSMLAFAVLWKRSYHKASEFLGSVIYEDPWVAGGHNGISNREDPQKPERPYERVLALRKFMNSVGLGKMTIIIAGGVWNLSEWKDYIENPELQPLAFQFGTRPLLTKESPIPEAWKMSLFNVPEGAVKLHKFSPTGFYSSAINNDFLQELYERSARQVAFSDQMTGLCTAEFKIGRRSVFVAPSDLVKIERWIGEGFTDPLKTPDQTLIFVSQSRREQILEDQKNCIGCLSRCKFSNWDEKNGTTGILADPRSFCISKTLYDIVTGDPNDPDLIYKNLMFSGQNAHRFSSDPFYTYPNIPSVAELYTQIKKEAGWL